jgi:hypothetical protein
MIRAAASADAKSLFIVASFGLQAAADIVRPSTALAHGAQQYETYQYQK